MELQSGFVLAVLIAAVLLMDRLGGTEELGRRLYQVALAAVFAFLVVSVTALIFDPGDELLRNVGGNGSDAAEDAADKIAAADTTQIGGGIVALLVGLAMMRRWTTLPLGFMLGGLLLLLLGGTRGASSSNVLVFFGTAFPASDGAKIANALVLAGGLSALVWWGFNQYEPQMHERDYDDLEEAGAAADTDVQ